MMIKMGYLRAAALVCAGVLASASVGCMADDTPQGAATGPGIENPAAAPYGSVPPGIGGAGNGGGVSGGGAGAGGMGQGR